MTNYTIFRSPHTREMKYAALPTKKAAKALEIPVSPLYTVENEVAPNRSYLHYRAGRDLRLWNYYELSIYGIRLLNYKSDPRFAIRRSCAYYLDNEVYKPDYNSRIFSIEGEHFRTEQTALLHVLFDFHETDDTRTQYRQGDFLLYEYPAYNEDVPSYQVKYKNELLGSGLNFRQTLWTIIEKKVRN